MNRRILLAALMTSIIMGMPFVDAAETTVIEQVITIYPNETGYNITYNYSDPTNQSQTNYIQTILPFINETGIEGVTTCGLTPSIVAQVSSNSTFTDSEFIGMIKFPSSSTMSGSSVSWWRCPLLNISSFSSVELHIWHIDSPDILELDDDNEPNVGSHPYLSFSYDYHNADKNTSWYLQNVTAWNYSFQFVWLKVDAFIHTDEWYLYKFVASGTSSLGQTIVVSPCDIGDDDIMKSWFYDSAMNEIPADLDLAVIHQYGMGDAVSGLKIDYTDTEDTSLVFYSEIDEPVSSPTDTITFFMPFIKDITLDANARVAIQNVNGTWQNSFWIATASEPSVDFALESLQWTNSYSEDLFKITLTFQNETNSIFVYDINSEFDIDLDDTSNYRTNRILTINHPDYVSNDYYLYYRPYHALQGGDGYWVNTNIDPVYFLDGRVVNITDIQMKKNKVEYPFLVTLLYGAVMLPYYIYTFTDKFVLGDLLPDLNKTKYLAYVATKIYDFVEWVDNRPVMKIIRKVTGFFEDVVEWIVKYAPYIFAGIMKGLALIIFIPIWLTCIMFVNGVKRFFVILAMEGPIEAADYAENFFRNSLKLAKTIAGKAPVIGKVI